MHKHRTQGDYAALVKLVNLTIIAFSRSSVLPDLVEAASDCSQVRVCHLRAIEPCDGVLVLEGLNLLSFIWRKR